MKSLIQILKEYKIEIPVIQRDYVQGRLSSKATNIRVTFVKDLLYCLFNREAPGLHLDFIYGRVKDDLNTESIKNNYESVEQLLSILNNYSTSLNIPLTTPLPAVDKKELLSLNKKLLPLDGQQRLTTLWLLHFVIAHQLGDIPAWMSNFSYKTKKSSRDFCEQLLREAPNFKPEESYSEVIQNQHWFYYKWDNDPTIKSMLVMLDEIWFQMKREEDWRLDLKEWWAGLTVHKRISFSFLSLNENNIDDEIYIKMNSRGKQLSDFEIFKNSLLEHLYAYMPAEEVKSVAHQLDRTWLDLFWKFKAKGIYDIQDNYFRFFKIFLLYEYILKEKREQIDQELLKYFLNDSDNKSTYQDLTFNQMVEKSFIGIESCRLVFGTLDLFSDEKTLNTYRKWLGEQSYIYDSKYSADGGEKDIITAHLSLASQNIGYYDRTFMVAVLLYIRNNPNPGLETEEQFKRYTRICYNIIYNQNYIQNPETFIQAVKSINVISSYGDDIYRKLKEMDPSTVNFKNEQLAEEKLKIAFIENNSEVEKELMIIEKHEYFRGQIGFLIELSGGEEDFNLEKFVSYRNKLIFLFEKDFRNADHKLFERALLTQTNYFINKEHSRWMYCDNSSGLRPKQEGWRLVFKKNLEEIKVILDLLKIGKEKESLLKIVKDYNKDTWRKYFVKCSKVWGSCDNRMIKKTDEDWSVRLLKNNNAGGTQRELRSKYFEICYNNDSKKSAAPFKELRYRDAKKQDEKPCSVFDSWFFEGKEYYLDIAFENRQFELTFSYRNNNGNQISEGIMEILNSHDYEISEDFEGLAYNKFIENFDLLNIHIDQLLSNFKKLKADSKVAEINLNLEIQ
jgi:hypothetical protein